MTFEELSLDPRLIGGIRRLGFQKPTEIQASAIPVIAKGRDLMAAARTGSGKTVAFAVPSLQRLLQPARLAVRGPRLLVVAPTRELAQQVAGVYLDLGQFMKLKVVTLVGGASIEDQAQRLSKKHDLVVATPGRLLDHLENGRVSFQRLEILVLDEADRMLDMGFIEDVRKILAHLPEERQTLLFSATLGGRVQKIGEEMLRSAVSIEGDDPKRRHEDIDQLVYLTRTRDQKIERLATLLEQKRKGRTLVFVATKRTADYLAKRLFDRGRRCGVLHGDRTQGARNQTLRSLRSGELDVVIATDVAARGLDVEGLDRVINFDLPQGGREYVHRIGRTGRAGAKGTAISLVEPKDVWRLERIEQSLRQTIRRVESEATQ
ncbi:MAG: DEAD/DEAH box helicase [Planctomycetota bacterium]